MEDSHRCDDDVAHAHAGGSDNKEGLTSEFVEEQHSGNGEEDLQNTSHTSGEQVGGCGRETEALKDLRGVVED